MSQSWNYSDTAVDSAVGVIHPASINFDVDFAKKSSDNNSFTIVNVTSPLDRQETARFGCTKINNVYSGVGLDASNYSQNKAGVSILIQDNTVLTVTDSSGIRIDYPISAHLVMRIPYAAPIDASLLTTILARLIGFCYEKSDTTAGPRLNKILRGALTPAVMV